jgi:hypothetical protein
MLPVVALVLLGAFAFRSPVQTSVESSTTSKAAAEQAKTHPDIAEEQVLPTGKIPVLQPQLNCTLRVLRADPHLDPGMLRDVVREVDPRMVVRSRCADPEW